MILPVSFGTGVLDSSSVLPRQVLAADGAHHLRTRLPRVARGIQATFSACLRVQSATSLTHMAAQRQQNCLTRSRRTCLVSGAHRAVRPCSSVKYSNAGVHAACGGCSGFDKQAAMLRVPGRPTDCTQQRVDQSQTVCQRCQGSTSGATDECINQHYCSVATVRPVCHYLWSRDG
jgi:hypothetical protein